jgi:glycosyltransferase involved in cell wall biosynthesis
MRVLHVANDPDRDGARGDTLGMLKAVMDLALGQKMRGYDVTIATDRQVPFTESCREHGISIVQHDYLALSADGALQLADNAIPDFMSCIERLSPDIIHCHSLPAGLVGVPAGNQAGIPCAFSGVGENIIIAGRKRGLRFATLWLTPADLPSIDNVYYVPNGASAMPTMGGQVSDNGDRAGIVVVGSLIPRKAVDIAILAMFDLRRRLGPCCPVLKIYGDGKSREYLTEMAAVLGLDDIVRFHGFKPGILGDCPSTDIFLMPSRSEACPLVVLEAMSRGMPIVATNVGDVPNILPDQRYGRIVPVGSAVAISEAVESLLVDISDGRFNPELVIERHRSYYSIEKWAERVEAVYEQLLLSNSATAQKSG